MDESDEHAEFFQIFQLCIWDGEVTQADWLKVFQLCSEENLGGEWKHKFGDLCKELVTHLYNTNCEVTLANFKELKKLSNLIVFVEAKHTSKGKSFGDCDFFRRLGP